jgi:uncharacterized protein
VTLSYAATLQPFYNAQGAFTANATTAAAKAAGEAQFLSSFGMLLDLFFTPTPNSKVETLIFTLFSPAFFLVFLGVLTALFMVCALRTNMIFVVVFAMVSTGWFLLAASYWAQSRGEEVRGRHLEVVCLYLFHSK